MPIKRWDRGKPVGIHLPTEVMEVLDEFPRGVKTRLMLAMLSLSFDPDAKDGVEFLLGWVDKVKRGSAEPEPEGLAKEFARRVLADELKKLERKR